MNDLRAVLLGNEDYIIQRLLIYVKEQGYAPFTSTLAEAWRLSVTGLSKSILEGIAEDGHVPGIRAEEDFGGDPMSAFGVLEARRHRERGVPLEMFLGLYKYYKQAYVDLIRDAGLPGEVEESFRTSVERAFDRIEIAFVSEWARASDEEKISELQAKNRAMTNEKNRFLTMVESHSDPALLADDQGRITYLNPAGLELAGVQTEGEGWYYRQALRRGHGVGEEGATADEGPSPSDRLAESLPWLRETLDRFTRDGGGTETHEVILPDEDWPRTFRVRLSRMLDVSGKFSGTAAFLTEVTTERAVQNWLQESEGRLADSNRMLQTVLDAIPVGVFWKDRTGRYLGGNQVFSQAAGLGSPAEVAGKTDFDLPWGEAQAQAYREDDRRVVESGEPKLFYEEPFTGKGGGVGWARTSKIPLRTPEGEVEGVLGVFEDITLPKEMELALRGSEKRLRTLVESVQVGIVVHDADTSILLTNSTAQELLGLSEDQLKGKIALDPRWEFLREDGTSMPHEEFPVNRVLDTKALLQDFVVGVFRPETEDVKWVLVNAVPELDPDGEVSQVLVTFVDITERKQAEGRLRRSEAMLEAAQAIAQVGHWEYEPDAAVITGSNELYRIFGGPREELETLEAFVALMDPRDRDRVLEAIQEAMVEGVPYNVDYRIICPDGTAKVVHAEGERILGGGGDPDRFVGTLQDITERWQAQEELRQEKEKAQKYLDVAGVMMVALDREGKVSLLNKKGCEVLGYEEDEALGRDWFDLAIPPGQSAEVREVFKQLVAGQVELAGEYENPVVTSSGEERLIAWRNTVLRDERGSIIGTLGSGEDVTDQRRAEEELLERDAKLESIFRAAPVGIAVSENRRLLEVNEAFCRMTGYAPEEILGRSARILYPDEATFLEVAEKIYPTVRSHGQGTVDSRIVSKDGEAREVLISVAPMDPKDPKGPLTCIVVDITERKETEEKLKEFATTQEVLLREVNHRVKNNLSAIISILHKEEERATRSGGSAYLPMLQDLIVRVRGLSTVHTLLSAGGWRPLDLGSLCLGVVKGSLEVLSAAPSVTVDVDAEKVEVDGDRAHHLTLVLNELAANIVKHALKDRESARVHIQVRKRNGSVRIEVRDDGPGYPEEMVVGDLSGASLGFQLIRGITIRSLRGHVEIGNEGGAVTRLEFPNPGNEPRTGSRSG